MVATAVAQFAVLLGLALILGGVARRLRLPAMVGEVTAGVVLGPSLLGWVAPGLHDRLLGDGLSGSVSMIATLGMVLMVGLAATELDGGFLREHRGVVASVAGWSFAVPLLLGVGAGVVLVEIADSSGLPSGVVPGSGTTASATSTAEFALLLGTALSVSAIPVIARILIELDLLRRGIGQLILAAAALTDVGAWLLLAVVSAMATVGVRDLHLAVSVVALIAVIGATWLIRRPVQRGIDCARGRLGDARLGSTVLNAVALLIIIGCAAASSALHLEVVLGAFLAGILLGRYHGEALGPLRAVTNNVLAPLFLATAGLHLDIRALGETSILIVAAVILVLAVIGKLAGSYIGARLVGVSRRHAVSLGAGLNARGVVEIVIASVGVKLGVFTEEIATIIVLVAVVTSLMAGPMLARLLRDEHPATPDVGMRSDDSATTKKSPSEQYSDLDDLHRAGWALNNEVANTSRPQAGTRSITPRR